MKRSAAVALLALLGAACASSSWEKTARVEIGPAAARLYVPRTFAPLVAGSIYPDRTRPVPSRGLGAVLALVRDVPVRAVAAPFGSRGLVVLAGGPGVPAPEALARLLALPEAGGRVGLFLSGIAAPIPPDVTAAVIVGEPGSLPRFHPPVLVLRVGSPSGPPANGVSERWYASRSGKLPRVALQDAAGWLAERLREPERQAGSVP